MNAVTIIHHNSQIAYYRNRLMDLRDERIRAQRKVIELRDIEIWEPENFTASHSQLIAIYENHINTIKRQECYLHSLIYA